MLVIQNVLLYISTDMILFHHIERCYYQEGIMILELMNGDAIV